MKINVEWEIREAASSLIQRVVLQCLTVIHVPCKELQLFKSEIKHSFPFNLCVLSSQMVPNLLEHKYVISCLDRTTK